MIDEKAEHDQDYTEKRQIDDLRLAIHGFVKARPGQCSRSTVDALLAASDRLREDSDRIVRVWD